MGSQSGWGVLGGFNKRPTTENIYNLLVGGLKVLVEEGGGAVEADLVAAVDQLIDEVVDVVHALVKVFAADLKKRRKFFSMRFRQQRRGCCLHAVAAEVFLTKYYLGPTYLKYSNIALVGD